MYLARGIIPTLFAQTLDWYPYVLSDHDSLEQIYFRFCDILIFLYLVRYKFHVVRVYAMVFVTRKIK